MYSSPTLNSACAKWLPRDVLNLVCGQVANPGMRQSLHTGQFIHGVANKEKEDQNWFVDEQPSLHWGLDTLGSRLFFKHQ
jgi:hypothetical protein